jgi:hypothetical protein
MFMYTWTWWGHCISPFPRVNFLKMCCFREYQISKFNIKNATSGLVRVNVNSEIFSYSEVTQTILFFINVVSL